MHRLVCIRLILFLSCSFLVACNASKGTFSATSAEYHTLNRQAGVAKNIWITLDNGEYYFAQTLQVGADSTRFKGRIRAKSSRSEVYTIPTSELEKIEIRTRNRKGGLGFLAGFAVGAGVTAIHYSASGCSTADYSSIACSAIVPLGLVFYGGGGALIGTIVGANNTHSTVYTFN